MKKRFKELKPLFEEWIENPKNTTLHSSEIAYVLKYINKKFGYEEFIYSANRIDSSFLGEIILEASEKIRTLLIENFPSEELAKAVEKLESDDATDLIHAIEFIDEDKSIEVLSSLNRGNKAEIEVLRKYDEYEAGAWMQTEFFYAFHIETVAQAVERLKRLKSSGELLEVYQLYIVNSQFEFIGTIKIDELLIRSRRELLSDILMEFRETQVTVNLRDNIKTVYKTFEDYNLQAIPVVNDKNKIVGRITSDDVLEIAEDITTEQVYNMAGVDEVEDDKKLSEIVRNRVYWLGLNLLTAILASLVIGIFDTTLQALIPLAILMPIVASMGGNAGTQTLTVVVRQIALDEIEFEDGIETIKKEVIISLINGFIFAILISIITYIWFGEELLGLVIGVAMVVNLFIAGFFGSAIPLILKKFGIDPAIGSTVLLTTATDIFGFFVFLGLAQMIILN
jgi:magnesium transporter